jgi:hypothetical protein
VLATHWKQLEQNMTALGCKSLPALLEAELHPCSEVNLEVVPKLHLGSMEM